MAFKKIGADRIFDGEKFLPEGTIVVLDEAGFVKDLVPAKDAGEAVRHYSGILLPGLINAHCHLELSHFKNLIPSGGGLIKFLFSVLAKRREAGQPEELQEKISAAAQEMWGGGIVAVGDICNGADAIAAKKSSPLLWHNLIEVLAFSDETLPQRWAANQKVLETHLAAGLVQTVLTPHAAYSVTPKTFEALNKATAAKTISIHNQETPAEDELFKSGTGDFLQLYNLTKTAPLGPTGKSSLQSWLPYFTAGQTIISVHNTFIKKEDLQFAKAHAAKHGLKMAYCLCPAANQYIEETLPPLPLLMDEGCTIVLGTDSYSSNRQLSIAAEIKILTDAYPKVPVENFLKGATANGADAFGWKHLGRLQIGTQPGLALLHTGAAGALMGTSEKISM